MPAGEGGLGAADLRPRQTLTNQDDKMTQDTERRQSYPQVGLLIDGTWIYDRPACHHVENPSDESLLGPVPGATPEDLARALTAARKGFETWRRVPMAERAALLRRTAALMHERIEEIATVITLEQGKTLPDARNEVRRSSTFLEWDAEQLQRSYGRIVHTDGPLDQLVVREPIGPVAAFTPWNVPLSAPSRKISGSLAAGCSVIIKPAEETPATACLFARCFIDAGLPEGVLQVVFGDPAQVSETLILSPVIRMITLTGSVGVGKTLTGLAARGMKPVLMELGGHAPVLIGPDVDPAGVAAMASAAKFRMAGQLCVSPSRFLVHRDVYEPFVTEFARGADALRQGDGFAEGIDMGPLANGRRVEAISALVEDARDRGARIAAGGKRVGNKGHFYAPTVLADVPLEADAMHVEPFGPLAACVPVADMDAALSIANSLEVGLAGYIFTNDFAEADRLAAALECGSVAVNNFGSPGADAPFGGYKESGIGREGGMESLDSYTISKTIMRRAARV
ncbi:putative aldehyde dehydrogenase (plasmid) [Celeribacter indicus]|uniref:Putative aldehyde dehydrogenase n=2 Tax=Celeribacter indicus TaxID=1208324 RepID=A0A0B5EAB4_9RHOB|nr:putative aldehyde dehydrogenase [Celeribacter indicus]